VDEPGLIIAAQKGDLDAFNRLVLAYQELAFNLAFRILSDEDEAADATQTAIFSAYRNLRNYRGGSFRAWLLRMVTNCCYDELRRRKRHRTIPLEPQDHEDEGDTESTQWMADDQPSPEQQTEQAELERAVQHCLNELPEDFRTVVVLVDIQGFDYQEVSLTIHKPLGTIKSRLARARFRMRDCLGGFGELLPLHLRHGSEELV
jgi:RNA polymerase sigma-70 factor (ECF subfamily)